MEHEAKKEELRETQLEALRKGKISVEIKGKIKKIEIPNLLKIKVYL